MLHLALVTPNDIKYLDDLINEDENNNLQENDYMNGEFDKPMNEFDHHTELFWPCGLNGERYLCSDGDVDAKNTRLCLCQWAIEEIVTYPTFDFPSSRFTWKYWKL